VERAAKCATLIVTAQPDVVLLQELVSPSLEVFRGTLGRAGYVEASPPRPIHASGEASYFCGIFVSRALEMSTPRRRSFGCGSGMGRELHSVRVQVPHPEGRAAATAATAAGDESASDGGRQWCEVLTSHFESCKTSQGLRVQQFLEMTDAMLQAQLPAIFAGDTNLRYKQSLVPQVKASRNWCKFFSLLPCPPSKGKTKLPSPSTPSRRVRVGSRASTQPSAPSMRPPSWTRLRPAAPPKRRSTPGTAPATTTFKGSTGPISRGCASTAVGLHL